MAKKRKKDRQDNDLPQHDEQARAEGFDGAHDDDGGENPLASLEDLMDDGYEIVELEAMQDFWDDEEGVVRATMSFDALLAQLLSQEELPDLGALYALSDLSRADEQRLREHWEQIAPAKRRALVTELVERAVEDYNLLLGRLLRVALSDADAVVRVAAVRGLWDDNGSDLVGPLIQMLRQDPAEEVRASAATALGGYVLKGELEELDTAIAMRVEEALLAILSDTREPLEVRRRALESVAFSGEAGVRDLIEDAYYAPDEAMRVSALFAMGRSADIRWRGLVRAELRNPSAAMRAEAATACGELGAQAALNDLLGLVSDRDAGVRLAAIYALGRIGGRDARDALETVLLSDDPDEVLAAEEALDELQFYADLESIPLFDESLDEDWQEDSFDEWDDLDERDFGEYEASGSELDDEDLDEYLDDDDEPTP
jgi:HEAT repeat protein